ncbi:methyltransferase domain-containing protein [Actinosynnema sp. NPDC050801]|uniref:methyltransferase domain-containing protein n=1 Tax=unclassified Actinosynnema TaxID=2637065 RepID=UPI0033DA9145
MTRTTTYIEERNMDLVREFQVKCMHAQRIDLMGDYVSPDLKIHLPSGLIDQGAENAFSWFAECTEWFTSTGIEVKMMIADGDTVFQLIELHFDHTGEYMGVPPTGKHLSVPGLAAFKVRDGRITDHWGLYEMDVIPRQLGLPVTGSPWDDVAAPEPERFVPAQADVTAFYDRSGPLITTLAGRNSHSGYWTSADDASSIAEATDALTDLVIGKLGAEAGDRVLDVGSGLGGPAARLARATGAHVVGVEHSEVLLAQARQWVEASGLADRVDFVHGDVQREVPVEPGSFDAALIIETFVHLADRQAALHRVAGALRPGGRVVLTDFYQREPLRGERVMMNEMFRRAMLNSPFPTLAEHVGMFRAAGLDPVEIVDVTDHVNRYYAELARALRDNAADLGGEYGEEGIAFLESVCRNCVATGEPNYLVITAVRADDHDADGPGDPGRA